jgi:protein gp37
MTTRYPAIRVTDHELLRQRDEALSLNERPWNLVYGCQPVSDVCKSCVAHERLARFHVNAGRLLHASARHQPVVVQAALTEPARWPTPQQVTVAPLADLFQPGVPAAFITQVIDVIADHPQHFFHITTRYQRRMRELLGHTQLPGNLSLGIAAEDAASYAERVPYLFDVPAAWRHVVLEPLLGAVNVESVELPTRDILWPLEGIVQQYLGLDADNQPQWMPKSDPLRCYEPLDWVLLGGERGAAPRPTHPEWARQVRDACRDRQVPFFFRGWGDSVITRKPDLDDPQLVIVSMDGSRRGRGAGSAINHLSVADSDVHFTRLFQGDEPIQFYLDGQRHREAPDFGRRHARLRLVDVSPLARELVERIEQGEAPSGPTTQEYIQSGGGLHKKNLAGDKRRPRRSHTPSFKAQIAVAALQGEASVADLSQRFDVHRNQITQWRAQLLERASELFDGLPEKPGRGRR